MELSRLNRCLKFIYNKGFRVIEGELYDSKGKKLGKHLNKCRKNDIRYFHTFWFENKNVSMPLHKLVAYQKFGDRIFEKGIQVRHLDSNSLNNLENNIAIGTPSENMMDIPKEKRLKRAIHASSFTKRAFTEKEIKQILKDRKLGLTYVQLCEKYNTSKSTLSYFFNFALYAKEVTKQNNSGSKIS